jgi:hypothetical protein
MSHKATHPRPHPQHARPRPPSTDSGMSPAHHVAGLPMPTLLALAGRGGRGNGPAQAAAVQRMQALSGNRATRRAIQRVIHNGRTTRAEPFDRIRSSGIYRKAPTRPAKDLIVAMHDSTVDFSLADVETALGTNPLPSITDVENAKRSIVTAAKRKRNVKGKEKQTRKSKVVKGWDGKSKLKVNFKSQVGTLRTRKFEAREVTRGKRLIKFGQTALTNVLSSKNANTMQAVMKYINHIRTGKLTHHSDRIGGVHLSTDTQNLKTQPTGAPGYLAMTHVTLSSTDQRSQYGAFVRPDADQGKGAFHPLQTAETEASHALLNAVEAVRNDGQFIISMLLKQQAIKSGKMTIKHAVNPTKFGTFEIKEVSGQERDEFAQVIPANTAFALDYIIQKGGSPLADALNKVLEEQDNGRDTKVLEAQLIAAIEKALLDLTKQ